MRVAILGSRKVDSYRALCSAMESCPWPVTTVISGRARGVDLLGERWAEEHGIMVVPFPVTGEDWRTEGRKAGIVRNKLMLKYAEAVVAIWDGRSPGTGHAVRHACSIGLPVLIWPGRPSADTRPRKTVPLPGFRKAEQ